MDTKELLSLAEAYTAVYDKDLRSELEEMSDEFAGIEDLTDEEIDIIVEETIDEMLDEGYDFDEVEEIFEEVLSEAVRMDRAAARSAARREYMRTSEKAAEEARKRGADVVRREKRAEKIAQVKGAVKSAFGRVRGAVRDARKGVSKRIDSAKSSATQAAMRATNVKPSDVGTDKRGKPLNKGNFDTKYAKNRAKARQAIGAKIRTKVKRGIRGAALNVARKMKEEVDVYDVILSHLLDEGYADNVESAEKIMVNMSEEWRDEILDDLLDEKVIVTHGTSTNAAGQKIPWIHSTNTATNKSSIKDRLGSRDLPARKSHKINSNTMSVKKKMPND